MFSAAPLYIVAAGGTGGHVFPALSVAQELKNQGQRVAWVGQADSLEQQQAGLADIEFWPIVAKGFRGKGLLTRISALFALLFSVFSLTMRFRRKRVSCVVGAGGFVSAAAGIAACLLRVPLFIQEQNAVEGTTNRLLAKGAEQLFCGFPEAFAGSSKAVWSGNPVRVEVLKREPVANRRTIESSASHINVLVIGGSLGAASINSVVPLAIAGLVAQGYRVNRIFHQTGKGKSDLVHNTYSDISSDINVEVVEFTDQLAREMHVADIVISRSGAMSVSEIALSGLPAILVPYPYAIDDHQTANADFLVRAGSALLIKDRDLDVETLIQCMASVMSQIDQFKQAAGEVAKTYPSNAAEFIANSCMRCVDVRR